MSSEDKENIQPEGKEEQSFNQESTPHEESSGEPASNEITPEPETAEIPVSPDEPVPQGDLPVLDGSWERKGRSITAAAISGVLGIGVVYFNVQTILTILFIALFAVFYSMDISDDISEAVTNEFKTPILIALTLSQYIFMLLPALWITKKWHTSEVRKYLRIQACSLKEIGLAVLITICSLPLCYYISYLLLRSLGIPDSYENTGEQLFSSQSVPELLMLIFVVAVTPAICEEVFFRGYFQRTLERTTGVKSFIIGGVLFGLFHMQPLSLISLSVLGLLFSFFYYRSKSIFPSSAAHFTNNLIAILLLYFQPQMAGLYYEGNINPMWVFFSLLAGAGLLMSYIRLTETPYAERVREKDYFRW